MQKAPAYAVLGRDRLPAGRQGAGDRQGLGNKGFKIWLRQAHSEFGDQSTLSGADL